MVLQAYSQENLQTNSRAIPWLLPLMFLGTRPLVVRPANVRANHGTLSPNHSQTFSGVNHPASQAPSQAAVFAS
jgi:hypothetical protein